MISVENVSKSYPVKGGRKTVLDRVNLTFPPGQNTALLGANGAGKSTLMRLLSGAEMADSGRVIRDATVSWPLGFAGGLHGALTGKENVSFVSRIYGQDFQEMLAFVEDFAEIGKNMQLPVRTYSSGMRARVAFGMSMAIKFDYYLIDEVIAVGDTAFKRKCKQTLQERLGSSTVILISHSTSLIKEFCVRGCVVANQQLLKFDTLDAAINYHEESMT